jgi:hypothetical protein
MIEGTTADVYDGNMHRGRHREASVRVVEGEGGQKKGLRSALTHVGGGQTAEQQTDSIAGASAELSRAAVAQKQHRLQTATWLRSTRA